MAVTQEKSFESITSDQRLGTLGHIEACARMADTSSITTTEQLQGFLQSHFVPESLAYFIFDNKTPQMRTFRTPERTAVIDTRNLLGYRRGPVFDAEYNYDPMNDNNYIFIYSRPFPHEVPQFNYGYHMRMHLTQSLDLDIARPLEAHLYLGPTDKPHEIGCYRTIASKDYEKEHDPSLFVFALQETAEGFRKYIDLRDHQ